MPQTGDSLDRVIPTVRAVSPSDEGVSVYGAIIVTK
jgi:hypothetical protein